MKALFLFSRFGIGGVAKAMGFVANAFAESGIETVCVSMSREDTTISLSPKIKPIYIDYKTKGGIVELLINKILFIQKLRKVIKKECPDVIVSFRVDLVRIVTMATKGLDVKIIGSERGDPNTYTAEQAAKYSLALEKCEAVVFQTENAKNLYNENIQKKSTIIPNPCAPRFEKTENFIGEREKVIISCGRLSPEKNFEGLIRAFVKARETLEGFVLRIYGSGPDEKKLKELIKELDAEECVFLMGNHSDVFALETRASLFVLNSVTEGMPNALIEAMLAGIPCVASDCPVGGVSFIADAGKRVELVPIKNDEALKEAMIRVISSKERSDELIENAKEIQKVLDPDIIKRKWLTLVESIVD